MLRRLFLSASIVILLPSCVGPLRGLNPIRDRQLEGWCEDLTRGQAYYTQITRDLDQFALDSGWALQYGLAKGALEFLGPKLLGDCQNVRDGYDIEKEDVAWAFAEGADSMANLVQIHEVTTAPAVNPAEPLGFLSRSAMRAGAGIPHAQLLEELRLVQAEATAVAARAR